MDLLDVIDPNFGLVENKHTGKRFGKEEQLVIVGWSGRYRSAKYYILKCSICCNDPELFGEGYFKSVLPNLSVGKLPCGCAPSRIRDEKDYLILANRVCERKGLSFTGWAEPYKGTKTKCSIVCPEHGLYTTTSLNSLLNQDSGCRPCVGILTSERMLKSDDEWSSVFLDTGSFDLDTKFSRAEEVDASGKRTLWNFECPICYWVGISNQSNLAAGKIPCKCSNISKMNEAYINVLSDNGLDVALKFGISSKSQRRLKIMNSKCIFDVRQLGVWTFADFYNCRKAETIIKNTMDCGIISRTDMLDGFTETTYLYNLDKIISIYESNGGVKMNV